MKKLVLILFMLGIVVSSYSADPLDVKSLEIGVTGEVVATLSVSLGSDDDASLVDADSLNFGTMVQGESRNTTENTYKDVENAVIRFEGQPDYNVEYYFSSATGVTTTQTAISEIYLTTSGGAIATEKMKATLTLSETDGTAIGNVVASQYGNKRTLSSNGSNEVTLDGHIIGGTSDTIDVNGPNQLPGTYTADLWVNVRYVQIGQFEPTP